MAARAVEPHAGEAVAHAEKCLNCGAALAGEYCHRCGQQGHVHRTLGAFWHDLAHGVLHLDGKIWRTLPMLAWHPGQLTRRYVEGERARFVSPMALFLFSVFLMFAVFSAIGADLVGIGDVDPRVMAAQLKEADAKIAKLEAQRQAALKEKKNTEKVEGDIREAKMERNAVAAGQKYLGEEGALNMGIVNTGWKRLDKGIEKANKNPSLLFYKVQTNAYKYSWALIPLSVPFLWMLFLHRRRYRQYKAYDHVVFITYSIAFMSLCFVALILLRQVEFGSNGLVVAAVTFVPPIHMYRQLRGAYQLSRSSALWRTFALLVGAGLATTLFFLLLLALGVLG
jgi:hypothetical protein